jgi:hypothetical protein
VRPSELGRLIRNAFEAAPKPFFCRLSTARTKYFRLAYSRYLHGEHPWHRLPTGG